VKVARLFDEVDPHSGPRMAPNHEVLGAEEAARYMSYLDVGSPILVSTARMDDVVDPTRKGVVPTRLRTDGRWVWSDAAWTHRREGQ
jgi:hypothetical protein